MNRRYRISPEGRPPEPTDAEIARYRDPKRLVYNYHKATRALHRKPLYKDPKTFIALLIIVLITWLITEVADDRHAAPASLDQVHEQVD